MTLFEHIFYVIVVASASAAILVSYILNKRYNLKVIQSFHRFFLLFSGLVVVDLLRSYIVSLNLDSMFLVSIGVPGLMLCLLIMTSYAVYQVPEFVMYLCSFQERNMWLKYLKKIAIVLSILSVLTSVFKPFIPAFFEYIVLFLIAVFTLGLDIVVLTICAFHAKQAAGTFTGKIARTILMTTSIFFVGFVLDFTRSGFFQIFPVNDVTRYLETSLSIRFYSICYFCWSIIFLKNSLEILINDIPEKERALSEKAFNDYKITNREKEVIIKMSNGLTQQEIADELYISVKTVKRHVQNIYEKVNVNNRFALLNKLNISAYNTIHGS